MPHLQEGLEVALERTSRLANLKMRLARRHELAIKKIIERNEFPGQGAHWRVANRILIDLQDGLDIVAKNCGD